jgi:RNA polymerase sigma-70 factor (ECF subfamily)
MEPNRRQLFEVLAREHIGALHAFVRSAVSVRGPAEELVQETFLAAWQHFDQYDTARPFAAWLRGIARQELARHFRSPSATWRDVAVLPPEMLDAVEAEFAHIVTSRGDVSAELAAALQSCLAALGDSDRDMIHRTYRDAQTCAAVAAAVGSTVEAGKKRLQRIRAWLRGCILRRLNAETVRV